MRSERILTAFIASLAVSASLISAPVWASGGDRIPGSRYVSGRGAALGDSYIGLGDSVADALFYNPAAVAALKGFALEPMNLQFQANRDLIGQFGTDWYKYTSLSSANDKLKQDPGKWPGGSFAVVPGFGYRGIAVGLLYQSSVAATSDGTNITYRSRYQLIPSVSAGLSLASGVLRIGYSLQWVNQASGQRTVDPATEELGFNQGIAEGSGFSHNVGMSLTLPYIYTPSIHVVARNVGGLKLTGKSLLGLAKNPNGNPPHEDMSLDGAIGFVTKFGRGFTLNWTASYRDITDTSETSRLAHIAAGLELALYDGFFLRAGYGSGYPSAGAGVKTRIGELNLAWFSEEVGAGLRSERDIRYVFHYILRVF